jgi:arachidonate 5-lipoxygenase
MEAYGMATMRNLPDPHPIFKLLRPHFRYTMAINAQARATLINDGGTISTLFAIGGAGQFEFLRRTSAQYSVYWTDIVGSVKERGVHNQEQLPGYYYRDDGVKIWNATEKYVSGIIGEYYKTDEDVKSDKELQSWAEDIHTNGFPGYFGAKDGHDFPSSISNRKVLTELCTLIIFTGSAQHASINFGQYEMFGFIPNAPSTLRQPPPTRKGVATYTTLLQTLPDKGATESQVSVVYLLSQYSDDEVCIV